MAHEVTIGGERLGSGKKMKAYLHNYERSTHDLSYVWRSTMAAGTLVPFMSQVALPGDTFDINLNSDVLTHPTVGPLFGSYKVQLDVFQIPIRLYNGKLHMNALNIGLDMSQIFLPKVQLKANKIDKTKQIDNQQINPSCIFSYLGIRGLGHNGADTEVTRDFNCIPWLGYWDIYKNYYANKQEEIGAVIHKDPTTPTTDLGNTILYGLPEITIDDDAIPPYTWNKSQLVEGSTIVITGSNITSSTEPSNILIRISGDPALDNIGVNYKATDLFRDWEINVETQTIIGSNPHPDWMPPLAPVNMAFGSITYDNTAAVTTPDTEPKITTFELSKIDAMREFILTITTTVPELEIGAAYPDAPYNLPLQSANLPAPLTGKAYSMQFSQEGLALKTYNSDLFNNWLQTEWIDGVDGISAVTAIDTSGGSFTIDELNLSKKIYDMLNRIAISGGTYDDWLDAVYTHERTRSAENPMYLGGLIQNLVFQEVISNSASQDQPLGTLAGRGTLGNKRVGGQIVAKIDEPSYLMGIVSLTPYVDYSQGNQWDTTLRTMNDFHKPALDQIGFQDLITDQMAWWDTKTPNGTPNGQVYKSAGKQPAWVNYMTNVNVVRGNFAIQSQQMFMVLNRRYTPDYTTALEPTIKDLTTYIDPTKFNHVFADTRRDAQNFWVQIGVNIEARRKMSAKVMPNL